MKKAIQSKDQKDQTEKETGNDSSGFHVKYYLFDSKYIDINIIVVKRIFR